MCMDCNIGFRKHGVLAKHFRSKTHIMKLESLGKLPEDALTLITRKENGAYLNDIDTTDSERARASLFGIHLLILKHNFYMIIGQCAFEELKQTYFKIFLALVNSLRDSSSLECREQMVQSPGPPPTTCYAFSSVKRSTGPILNSYSVGKNSLSHVNGRRNDNFSVRQVIILFGMWCLFDRHFFNLFIYFFLRILNHYSKKGLKLY